MPELRVLIADDEPLVRSGLRRLLEAQPGVTVVAEARHGKEAVDFTRSKKPHLVFLDVQMPELDGFGVLTALEAGPVPAVVFVTAFDSYAIRAFDAHAVDYLLKPFDEDRFSRALARARSRLSGQETREREQQIEAALNDLLARGRYAERLLVKNEGRVLVVPIDDIDWLESADNYVRVHVRAGRYLVREPIKCIEQRLDPRKFARAHRSAIVNLARVRGLEPTAAGEYLILLSTSARVPLSRSYRDSFRDRLARSC